VVVVAVVVVAVAVAVVVSSALARRRARPSRGRVRVFVDGIPPRCAAAPIGVPRRLRLRRSRQVREVQRVNDRDLGRGPARESASARRQPVIGPRAARGIVRDPAGRAAEPSEVASVVTAVNNVVIVGATNVDPEKGNIRGRVRVAGARGAIVAEKLAVALVVVGSTGGTGGSGPAVASVAER
jgi:hypothetical protein